MNVLVLGLGNILLQDEGLGVRALERLVAQHSLPDQVQAMDGGTLGLVLLPYLEQATDLLILDAVQTGQPPGTLVRLEGSAIPSALSPKLSVHQVGLQELLALGDLQGTLPHRIVLWGMEPGSLDWGLELSSLVLSRLDDLVTAAANELGEWGCLIHTPMSRGS